MTDSGHDCTPHGLTSATTGRPRLSRPARRRRRELRRWRVGLVGCLAVIGLLGLAVWVTANIRRPTADPPTSSSHGPSWAKSE